MASNYLGPEIPRPFSLISEEYQQQLAIPNYPEEDQYRFGQAYEEAMFSLIHTHLELGTTDRFCYIGEEKGSFSPLVERKFCLVNPVTTILPNIQKGGSTQSAVTTSTRVDDYFRNASSECSSLKKNLFDRILIKDCIQDLTSNMYSLFSQLKLCLHGEGKLLIIHRPGMLNTLPLPKKMVKEFESKDVDIGPILNALQDAGFDVKWDIEICPIIMPKVKWLSMLQEKHPADLESSDDAVIRNAIRELTEGMFKYEGDIVQFTDRLLFISASPGLRGRAPMLTRYGSSGYKPPPVVADEDLTYNMPVTRDIQGILDNKARKPKANIGRSKAVWN
ncbi:uncharacterized protein [Watersipora subatra]|uniref:uncharacterized protein n=1 Tax=Watersipora subatra TaxID=2589382 RepID=UPI00355C0074